MDTDTNVISFVDATGKLRTHDLTLASIESVKKIVGVDLLYPERPWKEGEDETLAQVLQIDPDIRLIIQILYAWFGDQDDTADGFDERFAVMLGDSGFVEARESFIGAWSFFFRKMGKPIRAMELDVVRTNSDDLMRHAANKLPEVAAAQKKIVMDMMDRIDSTTLTSENYFGNSQHKLESAAPTSTLPAN